MALVDTAAEWGNDTARYRWARKWNDASKTVQNDIRLQERVRDPIISASVLGVVNVTFTAWSDWHDVDAIPSVDIVG